MRSILCLIVLAVACTACGIKGGLVLPPASRQAATNKTPVPVPAAVSVPESSEDGNKDLPPLGPVQP